MDMVRNLNTENNVSGNTQQGLLFTYTACIQRCTVSYCFALTLIIQFKL